MDKPKVQGKIIIQLQDLAWELDKPELFDEILSDCPEPTQDIIRSGIISNESYPEDVFADLTKAACNKLGKQRFAEVTRAVAKRNVKGLRKVIARFFMGPCKISEKNPELWKAMHNTGNLEVESCGDKEQVLKVRAFDFINKEYEFAFTEFHCGILELSGVKNVKGESRKEKDGSYTFRFTWD